MTCQNGTPIQLVPLREWPSPVRPPVGWLEKDVAVLPNANAGVQQWRCFCLRSLAL
jgi:hypothetical protein